MNSPALVLAVAMLVALPRTGPGQETRTRPSYPRDLITREEIQQRVPGARTALEVVQQLRPHFLRERSGGSISTTSLSSGTGGSSPMRVPVQVYIDGVQSPAPTVSLAEVRAQAIIDIRYLNSSDATTRFGTGHLNGAILVATGK